MGIKAPSVFISKPLLKRMQRHRTMYLFLLPTVIYVAVFCYAPMYGVIIAFKDYNGAFGIWGSRWVGLLHFRDFIGGYYFWPVLRNTLTISVYSMAAGFPASVILALMLNELRSPRYKKYVQTIVYAPYFISTVVLAGMIIMMLSPSIGIINNILEFFGFSRQYFMTQPAAFKHIYVWSGVWQSTGWHAVIYLAALSAVDLQLYEAATIDGASRVKRIWHINLPAIKPTVVVLLILSIGSLVGVSFEKTYLLQNELNMEFSEVINTYVYRRGILRGSHSFSTAVGLLNSVVNLILLIIANFMARRINETSLF